MVAKEKLLPPADPVGLLPDGSINIGTPDEMKAKWDKARLEEAKEDAGTYGAEAKQEDDEFMSDYEALAEGEEETGDDE